MPQTYKMMMAILKSASAKTRFSVFAFFLFTAGCGALDSGVQQLESVTNSIGMEFLVVPPGKFKMGSNGGSQNEIPIHEVELSKSYALGLNEVTEQQYTTIMGRTPRLLKPASAINSLTWNQATEFCQRLSDLPEEKAAGRIYRLPTEAEWEYACRAGTDTAYSFGDDPTLVTQHAWYNRNSLQDAHPPGQKTPNPWGFFDMHGNAWEWCQNWFYEYPSGPTRDPKGPPKGKTRVLRGGGWFHREPDCRSASRFTEDPNSPTRFTGGLRVAYTGP